MEIFERLESNVRTYCRDFPTVFCRGSGALLFDESGRRFVDFFAGAGALNYGHGNPYLKQAVLEYVQRDGIIHGLDMATVAKREFLEIFQSIILEPRGMAYKFQFPGPTGTNAIEAAFKIARRVTGRHAVISFTNAFHGLTLGALQATGNRRLRQAAGAPLNGSAIMPFDGYLGVDVDTSSYLEKVLADVGSGIDLPAAIVVETVQGEGGLNVAGFDWLRKIEAICRKYEIVFIVDDIQMGCGRTGTFFSFEEAGISPDIVALSKSLSGFGLPLSLLLIKPDVDQWRPGEHTGTFRGNNLAFVTASTAARRYWTDEAFVNDVERKTAKLHAGLERIAADHEDLRLSVRGRGLAQGLVCPAAGTAKSISRRAFANGLVAETSGAHGEVLKCLPPLTLRDEDLEQGLEIIAKSVDETAMRGAIDWGATPPDQET